MKQGLTSLNFSPPKSLLHPSFCYLSPSKFPVLHSQRMCHQDKSSEHFDISAEFRPRKWSFSAVQVFTFTPKSHHFPPPQCGHLRTKSAVENGGTALKEGKNQGEIGNLEAKSGGRLLWFAPKSSVRPTADNSRRLLFLCFRRQVRHNSPFLSTVNEC